MGYQESLMFCDTKRDLIRLCKLINKAAVDTSECGLEYACLNVFEVARLKKDVEPYSKGSYFVWWGGDRAAQRDNELLLSHDSKGMDACWDMVFAEELFSLPAAELLKGIEEGRPLELQENKWIRTFHPDGDNHIPLELIERL